MSLRDLSWLDRGVYDFARGIAKDDPPITAGSPEYIDWLDGWKDADSKYIPDPGEALPGEITLTMRPSYLKLLLQEDGSIYLTDPEGKVLGLQTSIILNKTEAEEEWTATVTFTNLKMVADETARDN